ncbi:MAG: DUF2062 domain-containing protein [Chthoniobacterales bacterium]
MKRLIKYFRDLFSRLLKEEGSPHSLAGGVAVGTFFGIIPLYGLKSVLTIGAALLGRVNTVTAFIVVCLFDILLPVLPFLIRLQYQVGFWILSSPHRLPPKLDVNTFSPSHFMKWQTIIDLGPPMIVGSILVALPPSIITYFIFRFGVVRWQKRIKSQASEEASA